MEMGGRLTERKDLHNTMLPRPTLILVAPTTNRLAAEDLATEQTQHRIRLILPGSGTLPFHRFVLERVKILR
jgi:hypothetical protein